MTQLRILWHLVLRGTEASTGLVYGMFQCRITDSIYLPSHRIGWSGIHHIRGRKPSCLFRPLLGTEREYALSRVERYSPNLLEDRCSRKLRIAPVLTLLASPPRSGGIELLDPGPLREAGVSGTGRWWTRC